MTQREEVEAECTGPGTPTQREADKQPKHTSPDNADRETVTSASGEWNSSASESEAREIRTKPTQPHHAARNSDGSVVIFENGPEQYEPFMGTVSMTLYIVVWILSLFSPIINILLFWTGRYVVGTLLFALNTMCYTVKFRPIPEMTQFFIRYGPVYFKEASMRFERIPQIGKDRPTILCIVPHGIFCMSWATLFMRPEFGNMQWCFSTTLRMSPLFRLLTDTTGYPSACDKKTMLSHMKKQTPLALIPGGFEEATVHCINYDRIYIKNRKGFIKYALQYGYTLTPTYCFGEHKMYWNAQGCWSVRLFLNSFGIPGILPWGRLFFPFFPKNDMMHIVVGKPIDLPKIPEPTPEEIDAAQQKYIDALVGIFDRYKVKFYGKEAATRQLQVW